jgi:hypothetical protein
MRHRPNRLADFAQEPPPRDQALSLSWSRAAMNRVNWRRPWSIGTYATRVEQSCGHVTFWRNAQLRRQGTPGNRSLEQGPEAEPLWATVSATLHPMRPNRAGIDCDPHVTCRDQNRNWTARFDFSFVHDVVTLKDIIPPNARIPAHALHHIKAGVQAKLVDCRKMWWNFQGSNPVGQTQGACCLNNKKINGQIVIAATFDPVNCKTFVALADGTVYEWPP